VARTSKAAAAAAAAQSAEQVGLAELEGLLVGASATGPAQEPGPAPEESALAAAGVVAEGGEAAEVLLVSCPEGATEGAWIVVAPADGREVEVRRPPLRMPPRPLVRFV
jgi:hypothetical protein